MSARPLLLHVFHAFAPGGTEIRASGLINASESAFRHAVLSLTGDFSAADYLGKDAHVGLVRPPVRRGWISWLRGLRDVVAATRPDLIVSYNFAATDVVIAARPGASAAFVHNECGFGPDEAERRLARRSLARRVILNSVFRTVVVSETLYRIASEEFGIRRSRLQLIHTGVCTDRFVPGRNLAVRRTLGIADDELVFGFVGNLRPEKRLDLLIRAFSAVGLTRARLLIVGRGALRRELEELARSVASPHAVLFVDHVQDPLPYYQALDVFVMSSITEQTSNAQLEAMACGKPCVVTDVGDSRRLLGEGARHQVVEAGGEGAYVTALRHIANDRRVLSDLGARNRARCVAEYAFSTMCREYQRVWHEAVASARRSSTVVPA